MADVEIRFTGDDADALATIASVDAALATIEKLAERISKALADIDIPSGTVGKIAAEAATIRTALAGIESQANDTQRALDGVALRAGPGTLLAAAVTGRFFNDQGRSFVAPQGGAPGNSLIPYDPRNQLLYNRVFAVPGEYGRQPSYFNAVPYLLGMGGDPYIGRYSGGGSAAAAAYLARKQAERGDPMTMAMLAAAAGFGGGGVNVPWFLNPFGRFGGFNIPGARLGSLAGLAGFGAERIIGTSLGIGGSMLGGLAGGALYGLGIGGTMAVGLGTDAAGIGQAAGDTRTVAKDYSALAAAVAEYGKNSQQAAQAQSQLNQDLNSFSPVARQAVEHAAKASNTFKTLFDYFTGPAERTGAQIITRGIGTGEKFLPTLGKFASGNMDIIRQGLQPLFGWAGSQQGGLGIFTQLEQLFQQRLPTAVHAGTQAFELFSNAVLDAAKNTGGILPKIDEFLTKLNTPTGLAKMNNAIVNLMSLFRSWAGLIGAVGKTLYELFRPAVGLGQDFANQLHSIIDLFNHWLALTSTQTTLHNLFGAHRAQLDAIFSVLRALLPVLEQAISAFAKIETVVTSLTVGPLKLLADLLNAIFKIPFVSTLGGWVLALAAVYKGTKAILELEFVAKMAGWVGMTEKLSGAMTVLAGAETTAGTAAVGLGTKLAAMAGPIAIAAAAVYGLDKAIKALTGFDALSTAWGTAGFGADQLQGEVPKAGSKNPYPQGTSDYFEFEAGQRGLGKGQHRIGKQSGYVDPSNPAYKRGHRSSRPGASPAAGPKASDFPGGGIVSTAQWAKKQPGAGTSYQYGGPSAIGKGSHTDCSGFTQAVYAANGIYIGRTTYEQWSGAGSASGKPEHLSRGQLQPGDLVFFDYEGAHSHVGIYVGGDQYIGDQHTGSGIQQVPMDWAHFDGGARYAGVNGNQGSTTDISAALAKANKQNAANLLNTKVPNPTAATAASTLANTRVATLAQGRGELGQIATALGDLGSLPSSWQSRYKPALDKWRSEIRSMDQELQQKGLSQKAVDQIRGRIDLITKAVDRMTARIQTAVAAFQELSVGRSLLNQVNAALSGNLNKLGITTGPISEFDVNTLQTAEQKYDPQLKRLKAKLQEYDKELRDKTISQATVNEITRRMDTIQKKVTNDLTKIKDAAQTQLTAAQNAWGNFISAFDSAFQAPGNSGNAQIQALQTQLGNDQLAIALDQAQSAVLGGNANDQLAQQIVTNLQAALGVQTTSTGIPYTQQQLDNWLTLWGAYYASLGYTPQQMFDAFNKLLASVGLPPIDNPYSTGTLPLPPGAGGATATNPVPSPSASGIDAQIASGAFAPRSGPGYVAAKGGTHHRTHHTKSVAHTSHATAHAQTNVHVEVKPKVEIKFEKGLEWLDKHVTVIVDDEIKKQGKSANHRARSGRY